MKMKNTRNWTLKKHFILAFFITGVAILSNLIAELGLIAFSLSTLKIANSIGGKDSASIGIIGGADGPTAIYLSGINPLQLFFNQYVILFLILLVLYKPFEYVLKKVFSGKANI